MSSLFKRTVILVVSRLANQAIVLLSPMLLVRLLPVSEYGMYREFLVYAALVGPFVTFATGNSLVYFLPRFPEKTKVWLTQNILFVAAFSSVAITVLFIAGDFIRGRTSFDFVVALQLYVLFFCNLDFIEFFWLSRKQSHLVLYYSAGRLLARAFAVIVTAWLTKDAYATVLSLVGVEFLRFLLVSAYVFHRHWFSLTEVSRSTLRHQMSYFVPLGSGAVIEVLNGRIGMLFISSVIGVTALAYYVTGAFVTQIVNVLRGAIADVIFPEIMEIRSAKPIDALRLWRQATVWNCILLFPAAFFCAYYADAFVIVLFTKEYMAAIPVFATFATMLAIDCFDFHMPLRVQECQSVLRARKCYVPASQRASYLPLVSDVRPDRTSHCFRALTDLAFRLSCVPYAKPLRCQYS